MKQEITIQPYEQIFLQDSFRFQFDINKNDSALVFLPQTYKLIQTQKTTPVSFGENDSLLDSAIFERISMKNTNPLIYLNQCRTKLEDLKDKPWNQTKEIQKLAQASNELITNYMKFALITPEELFPNREISVSENDESQNSGKVAIRLLDIFDKIGFDELFFKQLKPIIEEEFKNDVYIQLLRIIYREIKKVYYIYKRAKLNIFSPSIYFYTQIIKFFLENDDLKFLFFTQQQFPWIPGPQGISLLKGIGSTQGDYLEIQSAFGQLLRISLLPNLSESTSDIHQTDQVGARVFEALQQKQTRNSHKARVNQFQDTQRRYINELTDLFRMLLKKGEKLNFFAETFRFLTACLVGNVNRVKEGVHLEKQNKQLRNFSSDAFMLNLYDIMIEISRKIFDRQDHQTYKMIDPIFWMVHKFENLNDQPLLYEIVEQNQKIEVKEAGNVSNLYFYTIKFAHFGLLTTLKNYKQNLNEITEMKKAIESIKDSNFHLPRLEEMRNKLEKLDKLTNQYEACIFDNKRIKDTAELYDTFIIQFVNWCQVDIHSIKNGVSQSYKPQKILNHLPEHIIDDIFEFHQFYAYHKEDYFETNTSHARMELLLQMATLLGTNLLIASNKYLQAKFIELTYILLKIDRKQGLMKKAMVSSDFAKDNFLYGLIKFYVDIESTGASHQFYSKFSYRLYANELLLEIFNIDSYQQALQKYQNDQKLNYIINNSFERMIKMIMNDLNYSMDEGWAKLEKINEEDKKVEQTSVLQQQQQQHQRDFNVSQVRSNLSHAMSTVKVVVALSKCIPQVLLSDLYRQMITSMFNHFLELLLDKKNSSIIKLIKFLGKQDFKIELFLLELSFLYTNLMDYKEFIRSILKDQRSFKLEYFTGLTHYLTVYPIAPIEKLILLTQQLQESSNEDIDIENLIEIPEKYQDPLQGTLIKDPVKLPSDIVVDRASIKMALLDKEEDPWTRKPLKERDLIEMPEFKLEIDQWIQTQTNLIKAKTAELFRQKTLQKRSIQMQEEQEQLIGNNLFQGRKQLFEDEQ